MTDSKEMIASHAQKKGKEGKGIGKIKKSKCRLRWMRKGLVFGTWVIRTTRSGDSKRVAYWQIDLLIYKYDISREDYKSKWKSVYIITRMRSSFVFATMFPRFASGAAKHSVCFPLV